MTRHTPRHTPHSLPRPIALALAAAIALPAPAQCVLQPEQVVPFEAGAMRDTFSRGTVYATVGWDPDGPGPEPEWLVIAGEFTTVRGVAAPGVAAWDGSRWRSFASSVNGIVRALAVHQGRLIAAGSFSRVNGVMVGGLIELRPDSWQLFEGRVGPLGSEDEIHTMLSDGENLYMGGVIRSPLSDVPLIRWDGTSYRTFGGFGPFFVNDLAMHNGELYATGQSFPYFNRNVARLDGDTWQPMGTGLEDAGYALTSHNGLLYAAMRGESPERAKVRAWDGNAWTQVGTLLESSAPRDIISYNDALYVTSRLHVPPSDEARLEVLRLDQLAWAPLETGTFTVELGSTRSLSTWKSQLIAAGQMQRTGARYLGGVARWTGNAWTSIDDMLSGSIWSFINEPNSQNLIAVGAFTSIGGVYSPGIARVTPAGVEPIQSPIKFAGSEREYVRRVLWWGDRLVVGGSFLLEGSDSMGIAIQEPGGQWTTPEAPHPWFDIHHATVMDGTLYAAANIEGPNSQPNSLFALHDHGWETISTFSSRIAAMCLYDDQLILSGTFTDLGWDPTIQIAAYDGTTWSPIGTGLGGSPNALVEHRGSLIAIGDLTIGDAQTPAHIARWDGQAWSPIQAPTSARPYSLASTDAGLLIRVGESAFLLRGGRWTEIFVGPPEWPALSATTLHADNADRLVLTTGKLPAFIASAAVQTISSTSIPCEADVNCDQTTDILDLLDFLQAYSGCIDGAIPCNQILADFNQDGAIDTLDALDFLQAYAQGCQ